jgi:hypothetical protein
MARHSSFLTMPGMKFFGERPAVPGGRRRPEKRQSRLPVLGSFSLSGAEEHPPRFSNHTHGLPVTHLGGNYGTTTPTRSRNHARVASR